MTYIFAPVIQNDRLSGEPVTLLSSSGGKKCTRLRRSRVNFWASWGFHRFYKTDWDLRGCPVTSHNDAFLKKV
jgi:hypothetical protein